MIPASRIYEALQNRIVLICATCEHFHVGIDNGLTGCGKACGGPKEGRTFPLYKGFLTNFEAQCYICCEVSDFSIQVGNDLRKLGVCVHHKDFVLNMLERAGGMEIVCQQEDREEINENIIKAGE